VLKPACALDYCPETVHRTRQYYSTQASPWLTGALDLHVRGLLSLHLPPKPRTGEQSGVGSKRPWQDGADQSDDDGQDHSRRHEQPAKKKQAVARREDGSIVKTVPVVCNSFRGDYVVATQRVRCRHASSLETCLVANARAIANSCGEPPPLGLTRHTVYIHRLKQVSALVKLEAIRIAGAVSAGTCPWRTAR